MFICQFYNHNYTFTWGVYLMINVNCLAAGVLLILSSIEYAMIKCADVECAYSSSQWKERAYCPDQ